MLRLKKKLFKYRIKLLFCYIKTAILFEFFYLWLFSPALAVLFLSKIELPVLSWVLGWQFIIMVYFNFKLVSENNFILHKWFKKIKIERNELRYDILEEKNMITKVANIKILPLGKH